MKGSGRRGGIIPHGPVSLSGVHSSSIQSSISTKDPRIFTENTFNSRGQGHVFQPEGLTLCQAHGRGSANTSGRGAANATRSPVSFPAVPPGSSHRPDVPRCLARPSSRSSTRRRHPQPADLPGDPSLRQNRRRAPGTAARLGRGLLGYRVASVPMATRTPGPAEGGPQREQGSPAEKRGGVREGKRAGEQQAPGLPLERNTGLPNSVLRALC